MGAPIDRERPTQLPMDAIHGKRVSNVETWQFSYTFSLSLSLSLSTCTSSGLSACTLIACPQSCVDENGNRYSVGQSFPAADGCNNW